MNSFCVLGSTYLNHDQDGFLQLGTLKKSHTRLKPCLCSLYTKNNFLESHFVDQSSIKFQEQLTNHDQDCQPYEKCLALLQDPHTGHVPRWIKKINTIPWPCLQDILNMGGT